ncbi:autotransporter domain-containing protein [Glaesserella sp.]|uniref:autotransporter domain-containing protein n=1 Tax=Glaesserella sp. TaxID=2094731 RepID=UPI0035A19283
MFASNSSYATIQPNVAVSQQITHYLTAGVDTSALHVLWAGGNDLPAILTRAVASDNATASVVADATTAAQTSAQQWATLRQAGVDFVIVPTVPNVAYTPTLFQQFATVAANQFGQQVEAVASGYGSAATAAFSQAFESASTDLNASVQTSQADFEQTRITVLTNTIAALYSTPFGAALTAQSVTQEALTATLVERYQQFAAQAASATQALNNLTTSALNSVGGNIVRIDTDALFVDMLSRPSAYGLTNTVGSACTSTTQTICTPTDQSAADAMLFADGFHPGPIAHKAMADYILNVLQTPKDMGVVRQLSQQASENALDFARNESNRSRSYRLPEKTVEGIAAYQHNTGSNVYAGFKAQFTPNWQFSALFGQQKLDADRASVHAKNTARSANVIIRYDRDNWWLAGAMQVSADQYKLNRTAQIGQSLHYQQAKGSGSVVMASLFGGYELSADQHVFALIADLNNSYGRVNPLGEQNSGPTRLQFDTQHFHSLQSGLGAEYRYQSDSWQPYVALRWVKEWKDSNPTIKTGLNGSSFETALAKQDHSWLNAQAGLQWKAPNSPFRLHFAAAHDFARKNNLNETTAQVGFGFQF